MFINLLYLLLDVFWFVGVSLDILTLEFLNEFFWVVILELRDVCPVAVYKNFNSASENVFLTGDILPYFLIGLSCVFCLLLMVSFILVGFGYE